MSSTSLTPRDKVTAIVASSSKQDEELEPGGLHFYTANMAPGISVFRINPMDVGLELCFTLLVSAMSNNRDVRVDYVENGQIGEVKAVHLN
jgi:hypothetical protein